MDSRTLGQALRRKPVLSAGLNRFAQMAIVCGVGLLLLVSLILVARRLAGALLSPLSPATLLLVGVLGVLVAWLLRSLWQVGLGPADDQETGSRRLNKLVAWCPSLALALSALALTIPGTGLFILFLFWSILIASELIALRHVEFFGDLSLSKLTRRSKHLAPTHRPESSTQGHTLSEKESEPKHGALEGSVRPSAGLAVVDEPEEGSHRLAQQLTRATDADGGDVLFGTVWAEIEPGARDAIVHVAFCPPFAAAPRVDVEQADGPDARIKAAHIIPTGVRLEARLAVVAKEPTRVAIELSVRDSTSTD